MPSASILGGQHGCHSKTGRTGWDGPDIGSNSPHCDGAGAVPKQSGTDILQVIPRNDWIDP
jgi:hypothetical protein